MKRAQAMVLLAGLQAGGAAAAADAPVPLGEIIVTAPPPNELEKSDRQLKSIEERLPELGNAPLRESARTPDYRRSLYTRPQDLAGSIVYDVKADNARMDARLP